MIPQRALFIIEAAAQAMDPPRTVAQITAPGRHSRAETRTRLRLMAALYDERDVDYLRCWTQGEIGGWFGVGRSIVCEAQARLDRQGANAR